MANLDIRLLGAFRVSRAGVPITGFKSNKARALLAYLAVESRKQHHRSVLASMLWPDLPEQSALSNLRNSISLLRKLLGDTGSVSDDDSSDASAGRSSYLLVSRDIIQFNRQSDYSLDVADFMKSVQGEQPLEVLEKALSQVEGEFLDGFNLKNGPFFEKWILSQREQIDQMVNLTLRTVANGFEQQKLYEKALYYARRQLEYMPWSEETNRQLIQLYGLTGNLKQATIQYETCKHILWEELGVEPEPETIALYEQVRDGKIKPNGKPATPYSAAKETATLRKPDFVPPETESAIPIFGRSTELQKLNQNLELINQGHGKIVFVTGEVGSGKTTLVKEFCQQAMIENPDLIGATVSHFGPGGAPGMYLPIRELTQMLCADNTIRKAYSSITPEQSHRMDAFTPLCMEVFHRFAPTLVELFLSPANMKQQARGRLPQNGWRTSEEDQQAGQQTQAFDASQSWIFPLQAEIFDQFTKALRFLSFHQPLLLVLDDLQWADTVTVGLLQYLGKRLEGSRILVVGAYRSDEVAVSKNGKRHILRSLINELRMGYGDIVIDLDQSNSRQFLDALFDAEPNRVGDKIRDQFDRLTNGNPLLAIELLKDLKERKIIAKDDDGLWSQKEEICWEVLPQRIDGMIEERISQLPEKFQKMLMVASIQTDEFVPAVIASILRLEEDEVEQAMGGPLNKVYRLVTPMGLDWFGKRYVTRYRFTKNIYQVYLNHQLDEVQRKYLQASTARLMTVLYDGNGELLPMVAAQLSRQFQQTGLL